jgi:hypothetical protein
LDISALWPIADVAALLFAQLFYGRLAAVPAGPVEVAYIVRACRQELAELRSDDARRMLEELRSHTGDKASQARLDFAAADMADMPDPPFSDPYHWAACFSLGGETVAFASRPPRPCRTHSGNRRAEFELRQRSAGRPIG